MRKIALLLGNATLIFMSQSALCAGPFDGSWNTTLVCDTAADGARGYTWTFVSNVRNGRVSGQNGTPGTPSSGRLTGTIRPDGSAQLQVRGITGSVEYNVGRVAPNLPFHFTASGHFDADQGSATRNELRPCRLKFTKG
jgi:hypothetical protein